MRVLLVASPLWGRCSGAVHLWHLRLDVSRVVIALCVTCDQGPGSAFAGTNKSCPWCGAGGRLGGRRPGRRRGRAGGVGRHLFYRHCFSRSTGRGARRVARESGDCGEWRLHGRRARGRRGCGVAALDDTRRHVQGDATREVKREITSMSIVILWYISCHIERSHDGPAISKRTSPTSSLTPASKAAASSELRSM